MRLATVARKPPLVMKPGDVCGVDVEGLGVPVNPSRTRPSEARRGLRPRPAIGVGWPGGRVVVGIGSRKAGGDERDF